MVLGAGGLLARRLRGVLEEPATTAARLMARALAQGTTPVVTSAVRAWSPALVAALWSRRLRRVALGAFGAAALADWLADRPRLDPARYAAVHAADDLAYGCGLWWGCWRARTVRPLLARVSGGWRQPPADGAGTATIQAGAPSSSR
jgi:hypothetical protein